MMGSLLGKALKGVSSGCYGLVWRGEGGITQLGTCTVTIEFRPPPLYLSSTVHPLVFEQLGPPAIALPAERTREGFLPGVGLQVGGEVLALYEALPALGALVRPLPGVNALVDEQRGVPPEALPAHVTDVGALVRVHPLVGAQRPLIQEALAALRAGMAALRFLRPLPQQQPGPLAQSLAPLQGAQRAALTFPLEAPFYCDIWGGGTEESM